MNGESIEYLSKQGLCWRCLKIFEGISSPKLFLCDKKSKVQNFTTLNNGSNDEIVINEPQHKRNKPSTCSSCLGILQSCDSEEILDKLCSTITEGGYDANAFSLSLSVPVSLGLRLHLMWAHLLNQFPSIDSQVLTARTNHLGVLKDVWRSILGPKVSQKTSKEFSSVQANVNLSLSIQVFYSDDEKDCHLLEKLNSAKFTKRRLQHRKFNEGVFTRQVVDDTLREFTDEQLLEFEPSFPQEPSCPIEFIPSSNHTSIFIAGRYNKYSRQLPQTPWLVEGERRLESSVQEHITLSMEKLIKSKSVKFSASGREDVDVRCIGNGRPFVVEFLDPKITKLDSSLLLQLQRSVNQSTDIVAVRDIQMIARKDTSSLKEGEEEKTKTYCALCVAREPVDERTLLGLNKIENLVLDQLTPIRVLHRRALSTRQRTVHSMSVEIIDSKFFKLLLRSQAGTYIKEFVHGDLGRTTPNLGLLLKSKIDILALDVQDIQLNWPPTVTLDEIK